MVYRWFAGGLQVVYRRLIGGGQVVCRWFTGAACAPSRVQDGDKVIGCDLKSKPMQFQSSGTTCLLL